MPEGIQQHRKKGWRLPEGAVSVARPSRWGNPYRVESESGLTLVGQDFVKTWRVTDRDGGYLVRRLRSRDQATMIAVQAHWTWLELELGQNPQLAQELVLALAGRDLACFCPVGTPCHRDYLLTVANFWVQEEEQ